MIMGRRPGWWPGGWSRCPTYEAADVVGAMAVLRELEEPHTVLIDLEPGVVPWESPLDRVQPAVSSLEEMLDGLPVRHIGFLVSNTRRCLGGTAFGFPLLTRARKPWTSRHLVPEPGRDLPVVVVGDQWLTDGLLAFRWRGQFVRLTARAADAPWWPRLQTWVGRLVAPVFFTDRQS